MYSRTLQRCPGYEITDSPFDHGLYEVHPRSRVGNSLAVVDTDRFRCDMVISLAIACQLVHQRRINFEQIVGGLAALSKHQVLLEFISPEDPEVWPLLFSRTSWYALDNFIGTVKKHFSKIHNSTSSPGPRLLVFWEK